MARKRPKTFIVKKKTRKGFVGIINPVAVTPMEILGLRKPPKGVKFDPEGTAISRGADALQGLFFPKETKKNRETRMKRQTAQRVRRFNELNLFPPVRRKK